MPGKENMKKEMIINVSQPEECRVAIVEDGVLEELYVERASQDNLAGNIYLGKVVNLEPSIQAAFVDFGVGQNGFLHISDVESQYFRQGGYDPDKPIPSGKGKGKEPKGRQRRQPKGSRPRVKPPIEEIFSRGDTVLVQVIKEGIGTKGPTLSTYLSIPGRYLVLMPALGRVGVSRKIEDDDLRRKLRKTLRELDPPEGLGFIVRTAGSERTKKELARDMAYLVRLWKVIARRVKKSDGPADVYEESDMIIRTIRDIFTLDVDAIYIDEQGSFNRAKEFLQLVMPRQANRLHYYEGKEPLFHKYSLEQEVDQIFKREVRLKEGGSIVIDPTEALVAIDVNSGNFRSDGGPEESAYRLNMIAAREIARQLRLRDLGGVIVNDFIDMRREKYRRGVEGELRDAMKRDRARTKILRTSPFGLIEMTRQRVRPSVKKAVYEDCPCCNGRAVVKTAESMSIDVVRQIMLACDNGKVEKITVKVHQAVADYLKSKKKKDVAQLEERGKMSVKISGKDDVYPEYLDLLCRDKDGKTIVLD